MKDIIRITGLLSFIFLAFAAIGCGSASSGTVGNYDVDRSLILPEKTESRPKIVAFGDSLTAGFGLSETESYPYLLQERLRADGFNYEVVNAGVSGETTHGGLERIDWVLEEEDVEILILELGANDLLRGVPPARMRSNLDRMIRKAKARGVEVLLCGMLAPPTMGAEYQREFQKAFPELASEHGLRFVPFLLEGVAMNRELNLPDGIHPNPKGTRIMTDNIYAELKPMLKQ
jgi:acyl-CoA thioesterase I